MDIEKIENLKNLAPGKAFLPGDVEYEKASQLFKRTLAPSVVIRPESSKDMAVVLRFLSRQALPFAIKSGGHSNIVYEITDDGVLIDLSGLDSIEIIDHKKNLVRVGAGALAGAVADKLDNYELGLAAGDSRVVGIGGLATGGGLGFLVRKYGALVDDIVSAEIVTADGTILEANTEQHANLFWAIRGGGSNFGIVTHFTLRAHPVQNVFEAEISYPLKNAATIIKAWRDTMRQAPAELTSILKILPSKDDTPASIAIHGCLIDTDQHVAEKIYAPLLSLDEPIHYTLQAKHYKDALEAGPPRGTKNYSIARNIFLKTFSDEVIEAIAVLCEGGTPPVLQIRHVAGAMNEHSADLTAFSHRDSEVLIYHGASVAFGATSDEVNTVLAPWHTIAQFGTGCYINMSSENSETELAKAFPPETLRRLQNIKRQYDPRNIFNANYNIRP